MKAMDFTWALAGAAVLALVLLAAHGWWRQWQVRRALPRQPLGTATEPPERVEPTLGSDEAGQTAGPLEPGAAAVPAQRPGAARREARLDPLIDAIIPLVLEAPVSGDAALLHLPSKRHCGNKVFLVEGLDTETGEWLPLAPGARYSELQAGVQMANRQGHINEIEYSEFVQRIGAYADALSARADAPDMLDVLQRARELDQLTSPLDAQLTVHLATNSVAWSLPYVQQVLRRHGFAAGSLAGRFVLLGGAGLGGGSDVGAGAGAGVGSGAGSGPAVVLNASIDEQAALAAQHSEAVSPGVREVLLTLDAPQVSEALEPYPLFHRMATRLAQELDATALDDEGQPLTLQAYSAIGQELGRLYQQLEGLGLPAGSLSAQRLFS